MENGDRANESATNEGTSVKSIETSVTIIESLRRQHLAGITDIARDTGISKSNVHKHLSTLQSEGFVVKEEQRYRLSLRYLELGSEVRQQYNGIQVIKPKIAEIAEETGEVAQFMVEERGWSVIVLKEVGHSGVSTRTRPGTHLKMHQVASGKAMLSALPREKAREIIDRHGLDRATDNTVTEKEALFEELDETRERGYALNFSESTEGLHAAAVPITKPDDGLIGACAVSGPSHRMSDRLSDDGIPKLLLSIANEIELNIAHS